MPNLVTHLWTAEQIALTAVLAVCGLLLIIWGPPGAAAAMPSGNVEARRFHWAVIASLIVVAAFLIYRGKTPVGVRVDSYSEANVIVSARNYSQLGLFSNWGAPH